MSCVLLLWLIGLNGCVVAVSRFSGPERLKQDSLPHLTRPITFDICSGPNITSVHAFGPRRRELGEKIERALGRASVPAKLAPSAVSPVDFTITIDLHPPDGQLSLPLSALTFSVVPGYDVARTTVDVNLASIRASRAGKREHLRYQSREQMFVWLPLILHPDLIATPGGVWESHDKEDAAFIQMIERLGDDIRLRLGGDGETPPTGAGLGIDCAHATDDR